MDHVPVERARLLELELKARLAPLVHHRGMHPAALGDLVRRAIGSGKFEISDGGTFLDTRDPADWLEDLDRSGEAGFLFESGKAQAQADDASPFGGLSKVEFDKLSPERKLAIANELEAKRRAP